MRRGRAVATRLGPAHPVGPELLGRELRAGRGRCVRSGTCRPRARRRRAAGDSRHRKLEVEDEVAGARMRPFFEAAGWITDRNAVMLREGRRAGACGRRRGHAARDAAAARRVVPQLREQRGRTGGARGRAGPHLGPARDARVHRARRSGFPVGFTTLAVGPDGVEIEQLYVTPKARGQRHRRTARRSRARRGRPRDGLGDRRRRRLARRALRAPRVRDRLAPARVRPAAALGEAAAAGEVRRGAHVAAEGGVGDDPGVPGEGLVRRGLDREVGAPARSLVVELGELLEREGSAEAAAELVVDLARDPLERRRLFRIGLVEAAQPRLPIAPERCRTTPPG